MIDILEKSYNEILNELRDLPSVEERKRYLGLIHSKFHTTEIKDSIILSKRIYKDANNDFEIVLKMIWDTKNIKKITTWYPYFRAILNKIKRGEY